MKKLVNRLLSRFKLVLVSKYELDAYALTVENKALLQKKIELWYKMYKGENFAKFFGINESSN